MLFGHGKTAFIAMLSPIPVILLFGLFFAPILMDRGETFYSIATFNDDDDRIGQLMTLILNYENTTGNITIYPVKEKETCMKLVDEGKVAIFIYVPQICYTKFGASFNSTQLTISLLRHIFRSKRIVSFRGRNNFYSFSIFQIYCSHNKPSFWQPENNVFLKKL